MPRRRLLLLLLCLLCFAGKAQQIPGLVQKAVFETVRIRHDSLPASLNSLWRYRNGDDPAWAAPGLADSAWMLRHSLVLPGRKRDSSGKFSGVAWFRIPVAIDTELTGKPLALSLQYAARSQIFLDGVQLSADDTAKADKDDADDESLLRLPVIFTLRDTHPHIVAIRFSVTQHSGKEQEERASIGFQASVDTAEGAVKTQGRKMVLFSSITIFFFTFFFAFALIHLVLFLFYRNVLSNLWFSLFCFGLGAIFLAAFFSIGANSSVVTHGMERYGSFVIAATCAGLSALVNDLFAWGRMKYRIAQFTLVAAGLMLFWHEPENYLLPVLITTVVVEAIVLIIRAIYRRAPGARILGAGILFFALTVIMIIIIVIIGVDFAITVSNTAGVLLTIAIIAAIVSIPLSMSAYLAWSFATVSRKLGAQLREVERLSAEALEHEAEKGRLMQHRQDELEAVVSQRTEELRGQKEKSDELLRNILPAEVAEELKQKGSAAARLYEDVSVLFTDFADFTQMAEKLSPAGLVAELDECFSAFDGIITRHGLEKIKTVGDAYIAVSGLPAPNARHAQDVVAAALEIASFMAARKAQKPGTFSIRLGVHSGPVVAGIVGVKKFAYDIWGDTVNTAARMEQHSEAGRINISAATYELVKEEFRCAFRGELEAKHKGKLGMYFVEGTTE